MRNLYFPFSHLPTQLFSVLRVYLKDLVTTVVNPTNFFLIEKGVYEKNQLCYLKLNYAQYKYILKSKKSEIFQFEVLICLGIWVKTY